jgi:hypothetical protein
MIAGNDKMAKYVTSHVVNAHGTKTLQKIQVMEDSPVRDPLCMDCGVDTEAINESYMVIDDLWLAVVPTEAGMLCLGCLEKRLGRELQRKDFAEFSVNAAAEGMPVSERLKGRLKTQVIEPGEIGTIVGKSGLHVTTDRLRTKVIKDNSDIGKRSGRRSSKDLVREEARRRIDVGDVPETSKVFANQLSEWLEIKRQREPKLPPMAPATIERVILRPLLSRRPRRRRTK